MSLLTCGECGGNDLFVSDSRLSEAYGPCIWRRRTCGTCGHWWTTYEVTEAAIGTLSKPTESVLRSIEEVIAAARAA